MARRRKAGEVDAAELSREPLPISYGKSRMATARAHPAAPHHPRHYYVSVGELGAFLRFAAKERAETRSFLALATQSDGDRRAVTDAVEDPAGDDILTCSRYPWRCGGVEVRDVDICAFLLANFICGKQ
jgi:hypothetical protein